MTRRFWIPAGARSRMLLSWDGLTFLSLVIVALTFWLTYIFSFRSVITHDYGVLLDRIYRIYLGEVPYRDFNLPTTPLTYLLQAALFKFSNPAIFGMKLSLSFMNSLLVLGALHIVRKFLWTNGKVYLLFVIPIAVVWSPGIILMHPWYDFDANFFAFFNLFSLLYFTQSRKRFWLVLGGISCGLSVLSKQNIGAGAFMSGLIFLFIVNQDWKERFKAIAYLALGLFLVAGIFTLFLVHNHALLPALDWIFLKASKRAGNLLVQAFHVLYRTDHNFIKFVFALYVTSAILLLRGRRDSSLFPKEIGSCPYIKLGIILYALPTTWFGCLAEGGNDYPQQQIYLCLLSSILFGFCLTKSNEGFTQFRKVRTVVVTLFSLIIIVWPIYKFWQIPFRFGVVKWDIPNSRMEGYYFSYSDYRFVKDLLEFEKKIPKDEKIFLWPDPLFFYFATDRKPITPLSGFVITHWESPQEDNNRISEILEREKVTWAIIGQETFFDFGYLRFGMKENWDTAVQKNLAMTSRGDMLVIRDYLNKNFQEIPGPVGYWTLKRIRAKG